MIAVHLDQVSVAYLAEPVFARLSWEIHDDRCVGLVGPNGSGKSTLLRLIAGELSSECGFVQRRRGLKIGYLPQQPQFDPDHTVLTETLSASQELAHIEAELARCEQQLARPEVYNDEKQLKRVLTQQVRWLEAFTELGGPGYESRVKGVLHSLGFRPADWHLPMTALSGGRRSWWGWPSCW